MQLTEEQAYLAMHAFLDKQYAQDWRELGGIPGSRLSSRTAHPLMRLSRLIGGKQSSRCWLAR
jgi:hypothetical protein